MPRTSTWIWIILLAYIAGFLLFPPRVLLINDEERYVTQALAFSQGALTVPGASLVVSGTDGRIASDFPPGTSLLQTPFVAIGGWRAAAALSVAGLVFLCFLTRALLREYGLAPEFALLVPAFFASLFFGRIAMSDVPAAAAVALSLWLLKRAERSDRTWSFAAGFASAICAAFREPVLVLLAPFVLAFALDNRRHAPALVLGGVLGLASRLLLSHALFGNALYMRDPGFGFSLPSVWTNLPMYALVLLAMFPLGAVLPFVYRGPQRMRVVIAFALYVGLFLSYEYNAWHDNGRLKGTMLAARFMIPLLPVMVLMAAEVYPRLYARLSEVRRGLLAHALTVACAGIAGAAFAIHPLVRRLDEEPYAIMQAMHEHTSSDVPVVTNEKVAGKYLSPVYGPRMLISRASIELADLPRYCEGPGRGQLSLAVLDREDSELFRHDAIENAAFLAGAERHLPLRQIYNQPFASGVRLRVFQAVGCSRP
jgi:hypothetical protein